MKGLIMKAFFEAANNPFFDFSLFYYFRHFAYLSHLISQLACLSNLSCFCCTKCVSVCVSSFLFNCQSVYLVDRFLVDGLPNKQLLIAHMFQSLPSGVSDVHPSHHDSTETANPSLGGGESFSSKGDFASYFSSQSDIFRQSPIKTPDIKTSK